MVSCKVYTQLRKEELKKRVSTFKRKPKLCVIQIGNDLASNAYVKGKERDANEVGIEFEHVHIVDYENFSKLDLARLVEQKNQDRRIDGIIVQLPIPDKYNVEIIQQCVSKKKDVDGFRKDSMFTSCTPKGIMNYLEYNNINLTGKVCTVIGRSNIVGKPLVNLLIDEGATVISCNSKTKDIMKYTKQSDVVISAIGKANYFDENYFSDDQILIDVGINRDKNGKLCGDICEDAKWNAYLATPVPNGVGLLTRLSLMENVIKAYEINN